MLRDNAAAAAGANSRAVPLKHGGEEDFLATAAEERLKLLASRLSPQALSEFLQSPDMLAFHPEDGFVIKRCIVRANGTCKIVVFLEPSPGLLNLIAALHIRAGELE